MAIAGGLLLIMDPEGTSLHLSTAWLHRTLFTNYLLPGILLVILVGGINGMALISQLTLGKGTFLWTTAGAVVLFVWTFMQMLIFEGSSWMQILFLFIGLFMVLLIWQLKGKWVV